MRFWEKCGKQPETMGGLGNSQEQPVHCFIPMVLLWPFLSISSFVFVFSVSCCVPGDTSPLCSQSLLCPVPGY